MNDINFYTPTHFKASEFVDPKTFEERKEKSFELIDSRMLWTMDKIRELYNKPITINNYPKGSRNWSGLRKKDSADYSENSQHSFGRAIDFIVSGVDSAVVRKDIMTKFKTVEAFKYITSIEDFDGMTWVHIDCRNYDVKNKGLLIFKNTIKNTPKK